MATTITAGNATNGAAVSSDNTGILELKTGTGSGTTAVTIGTTGNVNFPISGQRITGDFSNATIANRVIFQSSTTNGLTLIRAIPNGTATQTNIAVTNNSDPANCSIMQIVATATFTELNSGINGTGTYLPMIFTTGGSERMRIDTSGNVGVGTATVRAQEHIYGAGQTTAALTDAGNRGGMLRVSDSGTNAGNGGAILFSNQQGDLANSVGFAAIKGLLIDGSNNTAGSIAFSTRSVSTDTALTERARITYDGNFQFNSGYGSVATAYGCRAWVNFNGTGTVAIRASGNVSSITDNNTGDYTVNFTTAMPDANYSLLGTTSIAASTENPRVVAIPTHLAVPTASAARILTRAGSATSGTGNDTEYVYIAIFR